MKIYRINPRAINKKMIEEIVKDIKEGKIYAIPTETVYGVGSYAFMEKAVKKVYEIKKREKGKPLSIHVGNKRQVEKMIYMDERARKLFEAFTPGPITIVVRNKSFPKFLEKDGKVGIRIPSHPVAMEILKKVEMVLPSANISGRISPINANDVLEELGNLIDGLVDAGETLIGIESTIVDVTEEKVKILRPGAIPKEEIERILGEKVEGKEKVEKFNIKKEICLALSKDALQRKINNGYFPILTFETAEELKVRRYIPLGSKKEIFQIAKSLFSILRRIEKMQEKKFVIEGVEEKGLGYAVMHRLKRAARKIEK